MIVSSNNKDKDKNININIDNVYENYKEILSALEKINKSNQEIIVTDYKAKIEELRKKENKTLKYLKSTITEKSLQIVEKDNNKYLIEINELESAIKGSKDKDLNDLLLEVNQLYREIQSKYISIKFDKLNQKIDDKTIETENSTSSLMFNVTSIFLGVSITSAMITGFKNIDPLFTIFYFLSCAWIALTVLTIGALYLKKIDKKTYIILGMYLIYTVIWIGIGINSYNSYNNKIENEKNVKEEVFLPEKNKTENTSSNTDESNKENTTPKTEETN